MLRLEHPMIITPTGGLIYHFRALKYRSNLWQEFRYDLRLWLNAWNPRETSLLLIGPSGGHCLDTEFLRRFKSISAVDPDPLAKWFFFRNHGIRPDWTGEDYFSPFEGHFDIGLFENLLRRYPNHCVLFCNFLGQLPLLYPHDDTEDSFSSWCGALPTLLDSRSWASFHDRMSGRLRPQFELNASTHVNQPLSNAEIVERFYLARHNTTVELTDHLTGSLFPIASRRFSRWEILPGLWHLTEMVFQS